MGGGAARKRLSCPLLLVFFPLFLNLVCFLFFFLDGFPRFLGTFYHLLCRKSMTKIGIISFDTLKKVSVKIVP